MFSILSSFKTAFSGNQNSSEIDGQKILSESLQKITDIEKKVRQNSTEFQEKTQETMKRLDKYKSEKM